MSRITIVTDSTAYLPPGFAGQHDIHVVPLQLIWGEETFRDGVDIQPEEFYTRLRTAEIIPTTSQPSAAAFEQVFEELHRAGSEILAVLISSGISGTVASAEQARAMLPGARVEIVDTLATATELGFLVMEAAQAVEAGADIAACKSLIMDRKERSGVIFAVDTLEFLHRGGRIGGGKRFLGTMLNIKPLLEMTGGRIEALEQVRTRRKAHDRLVELLVERAQGRRFRYVSAMHADAEEDAAALLEQAEQRLDIEESFLSVIGPVLGTHAGPGTLALAYMFED
ncbi:MAG: DegV family protein [Chloroflexi bacterium]|nr:DegV family protein [Chloroflexota bacterium]